MSEATTAQSGPGTGARLLIDLGPLLVFFLTNAFAPVAPQLRIFYATGAFMAAMLGAMLYSQLRYRHISPLLLFSGLMVIVLGGITIYLHDETFIKIKPTIFYAFAAAMLTFGLVTGRNLLKVVLGTVYPGLSDRGWQLITRNFILFFVFMGIANELVWRTQTTEFWAGWKLWFTIPATFAFGLLNIPMLLRHGFEPDGKPAEEPPIPPTQ